MALWPYNNTGSIMPQQTCIWQQRNRKTTNTDYSLGQEASISLNMHLLVLMR